MNQNKQYKIDLWLFLICAAILLYLIITNFMLAKNQGNSTYNTLENINIPIYIVGGLLPFIIITRFVVHKTKNRSLAILSLLFSLLIYVFIGFSLWL